MGGDSPNSGTSCIQISDAVSAACNSGFLAIINNNKELLTAAFLAKSVSSNVWLTYDDDAGLQHCPDKVFTSCSVSTIGLK